MPVAAELQASLPPPPGVARPLKSVGGSHGTSATPILKSEQQHARHDLHGLHGLHGQDGQDGHHHDDGHGQNAADPHAFAHGTPATAVALDIVDIRRTAVELSLKADILSMFLPEQGPRRLPTLLLYDERGLQLFEEITYLEEYYLTNDEISVLKSSSEKIAKQIPNESMIIELGSGNLRKVNVLLQALDDAGKDIDYYALDLNERELRRTLAQLPKYEHVRCHGLLGTYDDGKEWLSQPANLGRRKSILSLGSSIGNFTRTEAAEFLREFANSLNVGDHMLIGLDSCCDPGRVFCAYNDRESVTHQFILNGLVNANTILGEEAFKVDDWAVIGEYVFDSDGGRHQAFYSPIRDTVALGELISSHERVLVEQSIKYSKAEADKLWRVAGMVQVGRWQLGAEYGLHLLAKPSMPFSLIPSEYAGSALPSLADWGALWAVWDAVSRGMLPKRELLEKPIKLRNACIFYLGHIPTFLDIQLTKTTKVALTEPGYYATIFERGIDPDVDNPEICHAHSEIPEEWPVATDILEYQTRVRARLRSIYAAGADKVPRDVGRAIWVGFEHELMHLETFLYILLQSNRALPPPGTSAPNWEELAIKARLRRTPNEWFNIPTSEVWIGMDDPDEGTDLDRHYGWDVEKPRRRVTVGAFQAQARPITNEEYAKYLYHNHIAKLPASWAGLDADGKRSGNTPGITNGVTHGAADHGADGQALNGHGTIGCSSQLYANGPANGSANGSANGHPVANEHGLASFLESIAVRTVYGPVPLKYALDWPVWASYDELAGCALWMGGRIPTFHEVRSIYEHAEALQKKYDAEKRKLARSAPAVNGHLSNDGVEETPPSRSAAQLSGGEDTSSSSSTFACSSASSTCACGQEYEQDHEQDQDHKQQVLPVEHEQARGSGDDGDKQLFIDLTGSNVGFQHWHPLPVTANGGRLAGQSQMGGVWEWTSTTLRPHEGFKPMALYPGYTADFFDEKHNIVLGGSWATHPRIAGRKSFVNWYQRNYPYAWAGARLVRDLAN